VTPTPGRIRRFRDTRQARSDGRRDGRRGIPTVHEPSPPPALARIAHRAHEALAELARGAATSEAERHERLELAASARRDAESDVEEAARTAARHDQAQSLTAGAFALGSAEVDRGPRIGHRAYLVAIFAILIAEFPLNAIAFRLFGEAEVLTWVMTASLAVTLVLCAHGLGSFLRQADPTMAERRWIVVLIALPVLTIVAIAVIRARYLEVSSELTGLDTLGPMVGSIAFLVINLLVYTGATMLSYLAHAPGSRDRGLDAFEVAQQDLRDANRRARSSEQTITRLGASAEEQAKGNRARAEQIVAYHRGLMTAYCTANLRARGNPEVPDSLRELPPIQVPEALQDPSTLDELMSTAVRSPAAGNGHVPPSQAGSEVAVGRSGGLER
jgi:hypothetical protein